MSKENKLNSVMEPVKETVKVATSNEKSNNVSNITELERLKSDLQNKREGLSSSEGKSATACKSMERKIRKAEKALKEYLEKQELPTLSVEFWEEDSSDSERVSYQKIKQDVIIAFSEYNMEAKKATIEKGKQLLNDNRLEKTPLYAVPAQLFYDNGIGLKDLNGNTIPKGTGNVYVLEGMTNRYWIPQAYYKANIDAIVEGGKVKTIENVQNREFKTIQDYAQYIGVNNILSRGMTGTEKAGIASLATPNEFFQKVFKVSESLKISFSTVTKYYNAGKTLTGKVWNEATLGNIPDKFEYDLTKGDTILETLDKMKFSNQVKKERYLIDALTQLYNYSDSTTKELVGFDKALSSLQALDEMKVKIINETINDKLKTIYSILFEKYIAIRDAKTAA